MLVEGEPTNPAAYATHGRRSEGVANCTDVLREATGVNF